MPRLPLPPNLAALNPLDLRDALAQLPQKRGEIGRQAIKSSVTLHYAGTEEPGAVTDEAALAQIRSEARYHITKVWGYYDRARTRPIYGDGIMYHLAVLPSGRPVVLRDLDAILYSCGNEVGNRTSLHVTVLRGINQPISAQHWAGFEALADALIRDYHLGSREAVKGHREWPRDGSSGQSICPGAIIFERLLAYRAEHDDEPMARPLGTYEVICDAGLSVRTGPNVGYPKANNNTLVYPKGRRFDAGAVVADDHGMHREWLWDSTGIGFLAADSDLVKFIGA